ncbi:hypothetical protein EVAR_5365_1 [Eumeta japonica]|uniref:Uncharacterized protein n=1 Tax=Eumeta variegata TaxID=151549 RepID=A0A4C1TN77_EUMVA|nr:hypothetical protein EVAR_5365_1 [Eumeta japonica]
MERKASHRNSHSANETTEAVTSRRYSEKMWYLTGRIGPFSYGTESTKAWLYKLLKKLRIITLRCEWCGSIRGEYIRSSFKITPVAENMVESRMMWLGHVTTTDEEYTVGKALANPDKKKDEERPLVTR